MSAENTSNTKRKPETTEQHDCQLKEAQEKAQAKRADKTMEHCDHWLEKTGEKA